MSFEKAQVNNDEGCDCDRSTAYHLQKGIKGKITVKVKGKGSVSDVLTGV